MATNSISPEAILETEQLWLLLALEEAYSTLEYYCRTKKVNFKPSTFTELLMKDSLKRFGLGFTLRFVVGAVSRVRSQFTNKQQYFNKNKALNNALDFWVNSDLARTYNVEPFSKTERIKRSLINTFGSYYLEPHGIDYFYSPIRLP